MWTLLTIGQWIDQRRRSLAEPDTRWRADPLAHPDLAPMTLRELADLPMPAYSTDAPPAHGAAAPLPEGAARCKGLKKAAFPRPSAAPCGA